MDQSSAPTFSIILKTVPAGPDERSTFCEAFASEFHLNQALSQQILESVPVALFRDLNRGQVSDVKPSLKSLSETFDTQFFITSSSVSALPSLTWPELPDFDADESDRIFSDVALTHRDDSIVCPECEHILVLDKSGDRVTAQKLVNIPSSDTSVEQEQDEQAPEEDSDGELGEDIETELKELLNDEEISESEATSSPSSSGSEEAGTDEENEDDTSVPETSDGESDSVEAPERTSGDSSTNRSAESSNGKTNVFLSGVPDGSMDEILDLLTEVRDCTVSEAEKLMDRPITPIMNGVTEEEAADLKDRFNEIGVTVNIVHK